MEIQDFNSNAIRKKCILREIFYVANKGRYTVLP